MQPKHEYEFSNKCDKMCGVHYMNRQTDEQTINFE